MKKIRIAVRDIAQADIPQILSYWRLNLESDLARLGEANRPDESANKEFLEWFCEKRPTIEEAGEDILIWEVEAKAVGYSTLKDVKPGHDAQIHLHMWDKPLRGKGLGAALFCLSASAFRTKFSLRELYCQPKWDNRMPNQMLAKIGCKLLGPVEFVRPDGTSVKQNRYGVSETAIRKYLKQVEERFQFELAYE